MSVDQVSKPASYSVGSRVRYIEDAEDAGTVLAAELWNRGEPWHGGPWREWRYRVQFDGAPTTPAWYMEYELVGDAAVSS